jgi:hypothetical protein
MKSILRLVPLFSLLLIASSSTFAQASQPMARPAPSIGSTFGMNAPFESAIIVTGLPLSYQGTDNSWHMLADGTRITNPTSTNFFWRDSIGRTRTERSIFTMPHVHNKSLTDIKIIEIHDPVAGVQYVFNSRDHVAYRYPFSAAEEPPAPTTPPVLPPREPRPSNPDQPQTTRESLGFQVIEGVSAEGTRTTTVFPVGWMGNDRPITRICDGWHSSELNIEVLWTCGEPPNSESVNRLTNISRAEPDEALFQVPSGYSIVDGPDKIKMTFPQNSQSHFVPIPIIH